MENPPDFAKDWVESFQEDCKERGITPYDMCRGFVLFFAHDLIEWDTGNICVIFGADYKEQVSQMATTPLVFEDTRSGYLDTDKYHLPKEMRDPREWEK